MFQKNIDALDNKELKNRLSKISIEESKLNISYCVTPSNDYIILKDGLAADDLQNPREAVRKVLAQNIKTQMNKNDIIINFGLGLGYLLDETFNTYPSKILIYEPDLKLIHFILHNVDISEHLSSGRVFLTNSLDELISKLGSVYLTKDKVEITYLPNYAILKSKELLELTQKVYDVCKSKIVDINTISIFSQKWLENSLENIGKINNGKAYLLSDLENKFIGQTAIIAGAGPSLHDNIDKIKADRNKYVIFAVNKSCEYLLQNNINPDFVVCLDARNMERTLGNIKHQLNSVNCIADIRTDSAIFDIPFAKMFFNFSENDFIIKNIFKYNDFLKFIEPGGSASTFALNIASSMGFSSIILAGVDLAFKGSTIYATGENINRLSQNTMLVDNVNKDIVTVKSVKGDNVFTRSDYETFIYHFETIIKDHVKSKVYNISSFGALIKGAENVALENIQTIVPANLTSLNNVESFKFDMSEFLKEELFHINNVVQELTKETFSSILVSLIVKSSLLYQCLQSEILLALQSNFSPDIAEDFVNKTKASIKLIVNLLQKYKLVQ